MASSAADLQNGGLTFPRNAPPAFHVLIKPTGAICMMSIDETFDVGLDTRTGVDNSYQLPFKFTGTIDRLTFELGPSQLSEVEEKVAAHALATAHD